MEFVFYVQGSAAEPYKITFNTNGRFTASCSCPAGENLTLCKHVLSLLEGDSSSVKIGEPSDLFIVCEIFSKCEIKDYYDEWKQCEDELVELKKKTTDYKRRFGKTLLGRFGR